VQSWMQYMFNPAVTGFIVALAIYGAVLSVIAFLLVQLDFSLQ